MLGWHVRSKRAFTFGMGAKMNEPEVVELLTKIYDDVSWIKLLLSVWLMAWSIRYLISNIKGRE